MAPRRPTAPLSGAARGRASARPAAAAARPVVQPRSSAARGAPAGRSSGTDRPPSSGRASSRPLPAPATPPGGVLPGGRGRLPLIRPVTMFSAVLVVLALLLAPYVRPWVNQRSQIAEADEQTRRLRQEVKDLTAQRKRWDDPAFVRAQARERLHFVMPGETGYVVLDEPRSNLAAPDPRSATAVLPVNGSEADTGNPWYAKVWNSVRIAGDPTTEQARSAAAPMPGGPVPGVPGPAATPARSVTVATPAATPRVTPRATPRASTRTTPSATSGVNR